MMCEGVSEERCGLSEFSHIQKHMKKDVFQFRRHALISLLSIYSMKKEKIYTASRNKGW